MTKLYLLIYSTELGDVELIKEWAEGNSSISHWRYDLPHCFYMLSSASAKELGNDLQEKLGNGRYLIVEPSGEYWGWLPNETWKIFKSNAPAKQW